MAIGDQYRAITPQDQLVFDSTGAVIGIRSGRSSGAEMRVLTAAQFESVGGAPGRVSGPSLVAAMGDSITADGAFANATTLTYYAHGYMTWAMGFSNGALWCPLVGTPDTTTPVLNYNRAVSGETAEQVLARVPELDALPVKPRFCIGMMGTNNLTVNIGQSAASIMLAIAAWCDAIRLRGITPVLCTLLPRGNGTSAGWASLSAGQIGTARGILLELNRQIRSYCASEPGVILADTFYSILNFASATSDPVAAYTGRGVAASPDYIHPCTPGAILVGKVVWDAMAPFVGAAPRNAAGTGDLWSTTDNKFGSFYDSSWAATGGTAGTGISGGTVPAAWTANREAGASATAAAAVAARVDGKPGNEFSLDITSAESAQFRLYKDTNGTIANGTFSAADAIFAECSVTFAGAGTQFASPDVWFKFTAPSTTVYSVYATNSVSTAPGDVGLAAYTVLLRTPIAVMPGTPTNFQSFMRCGLKTTPGKFTLRDYHCRKYNKLAPGAITW